MKRFSNELLNFILRFKNSLTAEKKKVLVLYNKRYLVWYQMCQLGTSAWRLNVPEESWNSRR